jgi:hypothetical protein
MPEIDEALVRIPSTISTREVGKLVQKCYDEWDVAKQSHFAELAKRWYDWREVGKRLDQDIETMRLHYNEV